MSKPTGYDLSRQWWTFAADNRGKVKATHSAAYYYIVEVWNLLGQPVEFGLPKMQAANVLGLNIKTFSNAFNELIDWGFIEVKIQSPNQFIATTISLSAVVEFTNATTKAHTNAILTQQPQHDYSTNHSTGDSTGHLIKPITNNHKPINNKESEINSPPPNDEFFNDPLEDDLGKEKKVPPKKRKIFIPPDLEMVTTQFQLLKGREWDVGKCNYEAKTFISFYESKGWMVGKNKMVNWKAAVSGWINRSSEPVNKTNGKQDYTNLKQASMEAIFGGRGNFNNSGE